jgi:hypothetical protein
MPSALDLLADAVRVHRLPPRTRPLLVGHALAVTTLVALTLATAAYGPGWLFDDAYAVVLPVVVFGSPVGVGVTSAALGGGLRPTLALGAAPSLAWAVAVVVGRALGALLGTPLSVPDSPLWAIAGTFLALGLAGAAGGYLAGRLGRLARRWLTD